MAVIALVIASLCVALIDGCGGEAPPYSMGATYSCLKADGYAVTNHLDDTDFFVFDPIAREARGGALATPVGHSFVVIAFERSEGDAKQTEAAYRSLQPSNRKDVNPVLSMERIVQRSRNTVAVWAKTPTDQEASEVDTCLRETGAD